MADFFLSIMAGVIAYYISKGLDRLIDNYKPGDSSPKKIEKVKD